MSNKQITNQYIQPYKYRINDIPFPLGYLHNQKKALVDHPWHGETWVVCINYSMVNFAINIYAYD